MKALFALLVLVSFNVDAAQKVYAVSNAKVKLIKKQLIVEGEVKFSIFRTVVKQDTLNSVGVIAPSLGCHQTYLCSARNFNSQNGQLLGDVSVDLDMDGNLDRIVRQIPLAEMKGDEVEIENLKIVYVDANRTIIEDAGKEFFFSVLANVP